MSVIRMVPLHYYLFTYCYYFFCQKKSARCCQC